MEREVIVFTKEMNILKEEAKSLAINAGFNTQSRVTKKTTILVVGDKDEHKYPENKQSTNQIKADELNLKGQHILILTESEFMEMIEASTEPA